MSNSSLVTYTLLSPNHMHGRTHKIDRITPHYMGGNCTIETCGEIFHQTARAASSNYGIGSDGRIGLYVNEEDRPWTSGSAYNDNRAVTIECANLDDGSLTTSCWNSLVALCVDICRRNNIERLRYTGDDNGNLTMHKWYQDTDCPGPWLSKQFQRLANEVNAVLAGDIPTPSPEDDKHFGGIYECMVSRLNVRNKPTINGSIITHYSYGQFVDLDDWYCEADGYIWGRYTGNMSGLKRYVALGRATGKVESDDFLIKVG